jgi:thiamine biosynthesis protein ThiC
LANSTLQNKVNAAINSNPDYARLNDTIDRDWDADAAAGTISATPTQAEVENIRDAVLELSDVVATLVRDLQSKDILGTP